MRFIKRRSKKSGLPPGSLIHIGEPKSDHTTLTVMNYGPENFFEKKGASVDECLELKGKEKVLWIDVEGIADVSILENLGQKFGIHPLVMEDILNTDHRPKMEDYGDYIYAVLKMLCFDEVKKRIVADQVSIILGKNFVISFQEGELDVFEPIRESLRTSKGRIRKMNAGYLTYSLIDAVVDNYFSILEKLGDDVEVVEAEIITAADKNTIHKIHTLKRNMLYLRKALWPLRELAGGMQRSESELLGEELSMYLKDVYDHAVYLVDTVETFRDMLSGMLDIYLSSINNKMNEVMKVLTIIATLFMPMTFMASIYGMNFKFMPELEWKFGYPMVLLAMLAVAISMVVFFKKKKWI